jgi:hypothetical protein
MEWKEARMKKISFLLFMIILFLSACATLPQVTQDNVRGYTDQQLTNVYLFTEEQLEYYRLSPPTSPEYYPPPKPPRSDFEAFSQGFTRGMHKGRAARDRENIRRLLRLRRICLQEMIRRERLRKEQEIKNE